MLRVQSLLEELNYYLLFTLVKQDVSLSYVIQLGISRINVGQAMLYVKYMKVLFVLFRANFQRGKILWSDS